MYRPMETNVLEQAAWEQLLLAFHPDRNIAALAYEKRRARLAYFFAARGCTCAEELTDEVFVRVQHKLAEGVTIQSMDAYLLRVAEFVALEHKRKIAARPACIAIAGVDSCVENPEQLAEERLHLAKARQRERCRKRCWQRMTEAERQKLIEYFSDEGSSRAASRHRLAQTLDLSLAHLRVEIHRIRRALEECVRNCWAQRKIGM